MPNEQTAYWAVPHFLQYNLSLSVQWQAAYYKKCGTAQYAVCSLGIFF